MPNFWDFPGAHRAAGAAGRADVRFLTEDELPPLHFAGPDGNPTGFVVELAGPCASA
jgi:polar amino acid transport system substrate-binding protein